MEMWWRAAALDALQVCGLALLTALCLSVDALLHSSSHLLLSMLVS